MICANILTQKVINNHTKLSKTKMQITHNERLAFFSNNKSFPKRKSYQQLMFSICVIRALQHITPLLSTC